MQPAQQQGLRFPSISSVRVLSIRWLLVSAFLADSIQQIHSLRASGVISSHAARAAPEEVRTFRKSVGTLCTTPVAIPFLVIRLLYQIFRWNAQCFGEGRIFKLGFATQLLHYPTGGGYRIRTCEGLRPRVFKTRALNHSANSP